MGAKLRVLDGNILYLIGALLYFFIGLFIHIEDERWALVTIQFFVVLLPPIIYLKVKGVNFQEALRLRKLKPKHGFLIGVVTILLYPVAMLGNLLLLIFLSLFGELHPPQIPTPHNVSEYIILILIVSIVAGIFEEIFFRGFMLTAYERIGKTKAIIITSVLFGVFHFNLYNLVGPIILGLVFGYLVFLTKSIYAGIVGHIVNNGFAMTLSFLMNTMIDMTNDMAGMESAMEADVEITTALLMTFIFLTIVSIFTGFAAYSLIGIIRKDVKKSDDPNPEELELSNIVNENEFENEEYKTSISEYFPLVFIVPLFIFISVMQIRQLLGLM